MTGGTAGHDTILTVLAKDGTLRDVAVCANDTPEVIGEDVIAAINGTRLFQLTTQACNKWRDYFVKRALLVVDEYLEREFADDPAQRDSGCELAALHDAVDAALDAVGLDTQEKRDAARVETKR